MSADMVTAFCDVFCGDILWLPALVGDIDVLSVGVIETFDAVAAAVAAPPAVAVGVIWFGVPIDFRASKLIFLLSFLSFMVFWYAMSACFMGAEKLLKSISAIESSTSWALNVLWLCLCAMAAAFDDKYIINTDVARAMAMRASTFSMDTPKKKKKKNHE